MAACPLAARLARARTLGRAGLSILVEWSVDGSAALRAMRPMALVEVARLLVRVDAVVRHVRHYTGEAP